MPDSTIDEIKRRLDVVDVIGQTVQLKRSGKAFKGLCPFHNEKSGSFYVWPDTGTWRCFGCNEGGDIFSFVQKRDNLDFREALRFLGERAGVTIEERDAAGPERPPGARPPPRHPRIDGALLPRRADGRGRRPGPRLHGRARHRAGRRRAVRARATPTQRAGAWSAT